jgi:hypothetical protein
VISHSEAGIARSRSPNTTSQRQPRRHISEVSLLNLTLSRRNGKVLGIVGLVRPGIMVTSGKPSGHIFVIDRCFTDLQQGSRRLSTTMHFSWRQNRSSCWQMYKNPRSRYKLGCITFYQHLFLVFEDLGRAVGLLGKKILCFVMEKKRCYGKHNPIR